MKRRSSCPGTSCSTRPLFSLQNIAVHIIKAQTKSIVDMEAALCGCEGAKNTGQELCLYQRRFQQITGRMFGDMERARYNESAGGISALLLRRTAARGIPSEKKALEPTVPGPSAYQKAGG